MGAETPPPYDPGYIRYIEQMLGRLQPFSNSTRTKLEKDGYKIFIVGGKSLSVLLREDPSVKLCSDLLEPDNVGILDKINNSNKKREIAVHSNPDRFFLMQNTPVPYQRHWGIRRHFEKELLEKYPGARLDVGEIYELLDGLQQMRTLTGRGENTFFDLLHRYRGIYSNTKVKDKRISLSWFGHERFRIRTRSQGYKSSFLQPHLILVPNPNFTDEPSQDTSTTSPLSLLT